MNGTPPAPARLLRDPLHALALGLGAGCLRPAPGTWGTLAGVLIYLPLAGLPRAWYAAVVLLACAAGVYLCGRTARALGVDDHPAIVWDEIAGFLLAMLFAPPGALWLVLGFGLFRLLDIWKPGPIRLLDRSLHGGLGIMADDLAAGAIVGLVLGALARVTAG